jgi:acyl-CoA thioesterase
MPTFRDVIVGLEAAGDGFEIDAPEGWRQGRTAYGGITAALAVATAGRAHADLPPLRSAQFAFVGPASGRLRFVSQILRQGRSATIVGVDVTGDAGPAARAILTYGAARESAVAHDTAPRPAVPPPEDCDLYFHPRGVSPGFSGNFEARLAAGARPLTPGAAPEATVWVRHAGDAGDDQVLAMIALADVLPPAAFVAFPQLAPISTATWTLDLFHPTPTGDWRLLRSVSEQAGEGYSLQAMSLWDADGRRLAVGRQMVAIYA